MRQNRHSYIIAIYRAHTKSIVRFFVAMPNYNSTAALRSAFSLSLHPWSLWAKQEVSWVGLGGGGSQQKEMLSFSVSLSPSLSIFHHFPHSATLKWWWRIDQDPIDSYFELHIFPLNNLYQRTIKTDWKTLLNFWTILVLSLWLHLVSHCCLC